MTCVSYKTARRLCGMTREARGAEASIVNPFNGSLRSKCYLKFVFKIINKIFGINYKYNFKAVGRPAFRVIPTQEGSHSLIF